MSGPLARLVAWLRSLGGETAAETDESAPAAPAGVCTVCGTEVPDPDGVCSLCGSADVRRADADGAVDATTGETGGDPGHASTDAAAESTDDADAEPDAAAESTDDADAEPDAAAESGPGPARRSVADTTDDDAARLSELRRRGEAADDGTDDAGGDA